LSTLAFFYNELSALLGSFRAKLATDSTNVSLTAFICTTIGTLVMSAIGSIASSCYVHQSFSKKVFKLNMAFEKMGNLVLDIRDIVFRPEPTCSTVNERV
jgi:hypothetical protein